MMNLETRGQTLRDVWAMFGDEVRTMTSASVNSGGRYRRSGQSDIHRGEADGLQVDYEESVRWLRSWA